MFNQSLAECCTFKAIEPVDMNVAAITGPRIKMDKGFRLAFVISMGASVGATVQFTLKQHNAAAAGTSKDLAVANAYFKKVGTAAAAFTKVEPTVAAALVDVTADFGGAAGVLVLEVLSQDLDVDGGFAYVSLDAADSTAAKLVSILPVLHEVKETPAYPIVF